jgi:hypothetical protein
MVSELRDLLISDKFRTEFTFLSSYCPLVLSIMANISNMNPTITFNDVVDLYLRSLDEGGGSWMHSQLYDFVNDNIPERQRPEFMKIISNSIALTASTTITSTSMYPHQFFFWEFKFLWVNPIGTYHGTRLPATPPVLSFRDKRGKRVSKIISNSKSNNTTLDF